MNRVSGVGLYLGSKLLDSTLSYLGLLRDWPARMATMPAALVVHAARSQRDVLGHIRDEPPGLKAVCTLYELYGWNWVLRR